MNNIKLDLNDLLVESFVTGGEGGVRGTVHAHSIDNYPTDPTAVPQESCDVVCATFDIVYCNGTTGGNGFTNHCQTNIETAGLACPTADYTCGATCGGTAR